jgi:methyl coenzyme M reductase subunit D
MEICVLKLLQHIMLIHSVATLVVHGQLIASNVATGGRGC